ncbi:MAG: putative topoisomerase, type [Betaproteobacteria bacterium]|nr:putative topoisomerase, type [Betaproteobacteria bacterium]
MPPMNNPTPAGPAGLPPEALREAQLRYVDDSRPGIRRKRMGGHFAFFDTKGSRIKDEDEIRRINKLAVPPAYTDVWICPDPRGHIQATGRDARGRKQYRYHARWREMRDADKYGRLLEFGQALPKIRARVKRDLKLEGMPRAKLLATIVHLLDVTLIRVGNEEYARANRSFGLTTLRNRHVEVKNTQISFHFRGKSGVEHHVKFRNARIAAIIRQCLEIPGQELFQYLDEDGVRHGIDSADVNDYLREISGAEFSAKDYRTWAGSALALARLSGVDFDTQREAKSQVVATLREVAQRLGNTPAVCRKAYVHPAVLQNFSSGELLADEKAGAAKLDRRLRREEARLLAFLHEAQARADEPLAQQLAESLKARKKEATGGAASAAPKAPSKAGARGARRRAH